MSGVFFSDSQSSTAVVSGGCGGFNNAYVFLLLSLIIYIKKYGSKDNLKMRRGLARACVCSCLPVIFWKRLTFREERLLFQEKIRSPSMIGFLSYRSARFWKSRRSYCYLLFHVASCPSIPTALRDLFALGRINVNIISHLILCLFFLWL